MKKRRTALSAKRYTLYAILVTLLCLILPQTVQAATYYLDAVNGNDTNPGTSEAPWKTMAKAEYTVTNGDTVLLRSGNYGDVVFSRKVTGRTSWSDGITFVAEEGETPVFTGISFPAYINSDYYVEFNGIHVINEEASFWTSLVVLKDVSYVRLKNMHIKGRGSEIDAEDWAYTGVYTRSYGYEMHGLLIENCNISWVRRPIFIGGTLKSGIIIKDNDLHHFAETGIYLSPSEKEDIIVIEGNHVHDQIQVGDYHGSGIGMYCWGAGAIIRGNIVHHCGRTTGIRVGGAGVPDSGISNVIIENNLVYDIHNVYPTMIELINRNLTIRNNTIIGRWRLPETGTPVVRYQAGLRVSPLAAGGYDHSTFNIHNNIVIGNVNIGGTLSEIRTMNEDNNIIWAFWPSAGLQDKIVGDNTIVIVTSKNKIRPGYTKTYFDESGKFFVGGEDFDNYSFHYSAEEIPEFGKSHGINLNNAYKLAANSPAVGFADPAHATTTDLLGNPRDSQPDAGCYEYVESTFLYGDVSGDSEISAYDAALTAQAAVELITLTPEQTKAADVSGDGEVSAYDAALIAQKAVGLIDRFPVES